MNSCRSCHAEIMWARTERGNRMALDPDPICDTLAQTRTLFVLRDRGSAQGPLAIAAWGLEGTEPHYRPHFDTCNAKAAA